MVRDAHKFLATHIWILCPLGNALSYYKFTPQNNFTRQHYQKAKNIQKGCKLFLPITAHHT